jgi:hypothetical protein
VNGETIVNVGVTHAQKARLDGTRQEWLGDYLVHRSPLAAGVTETVAVVPARGEIYVTGTVEDFDVAQSSPPNELLRLMDERAVGMTAWLALDDPLFLEDGILVNLLSGVRSCAPKDHYDAFVLLPESHLVRRAPVGGRPQPHL